jgi:hypothetical protein
MSTRPANKPPRKPAESHLGRDSTRHTETGRKDTDSSSGIQKRDDCTITNKAKLSEKDSEKFPGAKPKEEEQYFKLKVEDDRQPPGLIRRPTGTLNAANQGRRLSDTPSDPAPRTKKLKKSHKSGGSKSESEKIAKLLKLHFFRTTFRPKTEQERGRIQRDYDSAEKFVYGKRARGQYMYSLRDSQH